MARKNDFDNNEQPLLLSTNKPLTSNDLQTIIAVNQKSISINLEVQNQNEQVIEILEENDKKINEITSKMTVDFYVIKDIQSQVEDITKILESLKKNAEENERNVKEILKDHNEVKKNIETIKNDLFRLLILLGSAGVGAVIQIFFIK